MEQTARARILDDPSLILAADYQHPLSGQGFPRESDLWDGNLFKKSPVAQRVLSAGRSLKVDNVLLVYIEIDHWGDDEHKVVAYWFDVKTGRSQQVEGTTGAPERVVGDLLARATKQR